MSNRLQTKLEINCVRLLVGRENETLGMKISDLPTGHRVDLPQLEAAHILALIGHKRGEIVLLLNSNVGSVTVSDLPDSRVEKMDTFPFLVKVSKVKPGENFNVTFGAQVVNFVTQDVI
ncbi:hypothetical protein HYV64_01805 [Candidatus Shapirobacteria bacterium]|nr:hypothetical protein [Candidatus Shapirobacteria bacterium]